MMTMLVWTTRTSSQRFALRQQIITTVASRVEKGTNTSVHLLEEN